MKTWRILALGLLLGAGRVEAADSIHRIGAGANYWVAVKSIDVDDMDKDGLSYYASYQFRPTLVGLQVDFEMLPDRFGEDAYAPAAYVILGKAIYAAAGVGIVHQDGDWADNPFIALKAGLDLEVLPHLYLDISGSYRFDAKTQIEDAVDDIDTDTVFLGAAVRIGF